MDTRNHRRGGALFRTAVMVAVAVLSLVAAQGATAGATGGAAPVAPRPVAVHDGTGLPADPIDLASSAPALTGALTARGVDTGTWADVAPAGNPSSTPPPPAMPIRAATRPAYIPVAPSGPPTLSIGATVPYSDCMGATPLARNHVYESQCYHGGILLLAHNPGPGTAWLPVQPGWHITYAGRTYTVRNTYVTTPEAQYVLYNETIPLVLQTCWNLSGSRILVVAAY